MSSCEEAFEGLPVAVVTAAAEAGWTILCANGAARELLGYPATEELRGVRLADLCESPAAWNLLKDKLTSVSGPASGASEPATTATSRPERADAAVPVGAAVVLRRKDGGAVALQVQAGTVREGRQVLALMADAGGREAGPGGEPDERGATGGSVVHESEEWYRVLVEGAGETICAIDHNGVFVFMNSTAAARLGGRAEDYVGKSSWDVFPKQIADRHVASVRRVIETGVDLSTDSQELLQGRKRWYHTTVRPLRNARGEVHLAMVIARDVTDRKEAEEALRQSEERYRSLFERIPVVVYRSTPDGRLLDANPALARLFGVTPGQEIVAAPTKVYVNPEDRLRWRALLEANDVLLDYELQMRRPDGAVIWVRNNARVVRDAQGQVLYYEGSLEDITEWKQAQTALEESEEKYRQLFATETDGIVIFDAATDRFVDANDSALRLFGYGREEFLALALPDITAQQGESQDVLQQLLVGQPVRVPLRYYRKKDGTVFPVEISASSMMLAGRRLMCGTVRDISERLRAEETLQKSEEKYRQLFATESDAIALFDMESRTVIDANESALRMYGYTRAEFMTLTNWDLTAEPEQTRHNIDQVLASEINHVPIRLHKRKDGTVFPVEISASTFMLGERRVLCGAFRDITERLAAETALRDSEHRLLEAQRIAHLGIWDADIVRDIIKWSAETCRIFGVSEEAVLQTYGSWLATVHPDDLALVNQALDQALHDQAPYSIEHRIVRPDGTVRFVHEQGEVFFDANGRPLRAVGTVLDITARKEAEAEARQYEKRLQSLAMELSLAEERERKRLAVDLHDGLVQMLSVVQMRLTLLDQFTEERERSDCLAEITRLVDRSNRTARSLMLHLSHPALYEMGLIAAAEWLVEDMAELHGLRVTLRAARDTDPLEQRTRVVLFQCLRELLVNAAKHAQVREAAVRIVRQDRLVRVTVEDAGVGFDPLTRRPTGDHAGFGLFSIGERLRMLGGRMAVRSSPGHGTTVTLEVPVEAAQAEADGQE